MKLHCNNTVATTLLFWILFLALPSWGSEGHAQGQIYGDVLSQCLQFRHSGFSSDINGFLNDPMNSTFAKTAKMGFANFEELPEMVQNFGLTEETLSQLRSPAFASATESCFGNNSKIKSLYPLVLVLKDVFARTLGLAGAAALILTPLKLFGVLGRFLPLLISKLPGSAQMLIQVLKPALTALMVAFVGTQLFDSIYSLYNTLMDRLDPTRHTRQVIDDMGGNMRDQITQNFKAKRQELMSAKRSSGLSLEQQTELIEIEAALKGLREVGRKADHRRLEAQYDQMKIAP